MVVNGNYDLNFLSAPTNRLIMEKGVVPILNEATGRLG